MTSEQHQIENYKFFGRLCALPFIDTIYLYGSRARGDHQSRSDIDLAIVCPNALVRDWTTVFEIIEDADTLLRIDCVRYDTLADDSPLKQSIDKNHQVLYQKKV